jgi:hypothetical protein
MGGMTWARGWRPGLYLVAFESGGKADIKKLVVIRR